MIGFGNFEERNLEIKTLSDKRLVKIDTENEGFYDKVLNYPSENERIQDFIEAISEVKEIGIEPFYRPTMDPTLERGILTFRKGNQPLVRMTFDFWRRGIKDLHPFGEQNAWSWKIGTEYQYYAFLTWLINQLVESGETLDKAFYKVVLDSKELGHYKNSKNAKGMLEPTGSRKICGVYDLANTHKLLECSNKDGTMWIAGGSYDEISTYHPLANIFSTNKTDWMFLRSVAWLVVTEDF